MKHEILTRLQRARAEKRPVALVTDLGSGLQTLVLDDAAPGAVHGGFGLDEPALAAVRRQMLLDKSAEVETGDQRLFIHVFNPALRLVLVGAVHIAQALAPMAALAGYEVTIVDPRGAFATATRFPGIALKDDWPDDALRALDIDRRTAVITLTHDPKLDDPALHVALRSPAFYIGALGSRKTHAGRVARLKEAGFGDAEIARIHAPLGLAIGAVSPAEIAISALAQVTEVLHAETPAAAPETVR